MVRAVANPSDSESLAFHSRRDADHGVAAAMPPATADSLSHCARTLCVSVGAGLRAPRADREAFARDLRTIRLGRDSDRDRDCDLWTVTVIVTVICGRFGDSRRQRHYPH